MRFMIIRKADKSTEAGIMPDEKLIAAMFKYNEALVKAGVLLDTGGLSPSAEGTRVRLSRGKLTVTDGPFIEAKEIIGGYAIIQAKSKEQAIEWASRFLKIHGDKWELTSEIRQVEEPSEVA